VEFVGQFFHAWWFSPTKITPLKKSPYSIGSIAKKPMMTEGWPAAPAAGSPPRRLVRLLARGQAVMMSSWP
jgi:hypothetical protein